MDVWLVAICALIVTCNWKLITYDFRASGGVLIRDPTQDYALTGSCQSIIDAVL
jgi:hypothetical protein